MAKSTASKSEQTRQRLLLAAAKVVAKVGYHKASIARITSAAKLASGGFYYYFKTREDLFSELLPWIGEKMIAYISSYLDGDIWGIEREIRSFEAYAIFLHENPEFYRIFSEAYVYAPKAYKKHFALVIDNYCDSLRIQKAKGYLEVADDDIPTLAHFLIGMRAYFSQMYVGKILDGNMEGVLELYRRLLEGDVFVRSGRKGIAPSSATANERSSADTPPQ